MSILNCAITCQAVPDVPKPANVEAQPEEPSGDVIQREMDLPTRLWVWWLKQARNSLHLKLVFKHQFSWRSFKQCTFKNAGKSSGVHVIVMVKWFLLHVFQVKLVWVVSVFRPSLRTSAFGLGAFFLPWSQRWCHFTGGLSGGARGSRKQETGHASAFPFMPTKNVPRSNFKCRLCCLPFNYQFPWGIFERLKRLLRQVLKAYECLWYDIVSMQSADCIGRTVFPNACFPRQTKRRQKDARIPDSCFFSSLATMWILVAICCPFLDRSSCSLEAQFAVFVAIMSS